MTTEDDRRDNAPGRRLTDGQLLAWRKEGETAHAEIERDIGLNHTSITGLADELTAFRTEANAQFRVSRHDRDALKTTIEASQKETKAQFAEVAECINDLKVWQHHQDRQREQSLKEKTKREKYEDNIYKEMLSNFTFTTKLKKFVWGVVLGVAVLFGLAHTMINLWGEIKHLFQGTP